MMYFEKNSLYTNRIMLIDQEETKVTYGDLDCFSEKLSCYLKSRKLLFLLCENTIGSVMTYLSCLRNKVVPLLLDAHMEKDMLKSLYDIYRPDYIALPESMNIDVDESEIIFNEYKYKVYCIKQKEETILNDELALLMTTSGSTGGAKLVRQSYKNIHSNAKSIAEYLNLTEEERPITTLPMNYTYGLSIINSHILVGATILVTKYSLFEKEFWDFLKEEKATSFGGVPYTYQMLKRLGVFKMDLPFLKTMTQAGGKLPERLHKEFAEYAKENKKSFIVMYGQTEATARMSYLPFKYSLEKCGSIGVAIPECEFELVDDEHKKINEIDNVGELVYHGPNVTLGYAKEKSDLAKGDERKGTLFTGDLAKIDSDGFYYIVGRKKRFLKIYGNRVNLDEVEKLLKERFEDIDIACTGSDDKLFIVVESKDHDIENEILKYLQEKMRLNSRAFSVVFVDEIPKNQSGKILYKELDKILMM